MKFAQFFFTNEIDLTANNEYSGRVASFNTMWQKRYTTLNSVNFAGVKDSKSIPTKSLIDRCENFINFEVVSKKYNKEGLFFQSVLAKED